MSAPLLSAAMMVRDEAEYLPGCLASLEGLADEIVIVDTGSRDDTVAIAHRRGATVLHHPWNQDFSTPRNHGLDHCHGRWILCIDADERLRPIPRSRLTNLLQNAPEPALLVRLHPVEGFTPSLDYRLWRNDPRVRFRGVIHEKVVPALEEVARAEGSRIGVCELTLEHAGYVGDQAHKHLRNLPMLEAALAAEPENVFNWRHLAQVLAGLGRHEEAERALERAVELARVIHNEHGSAAWSDLVRLRHERGEDVRELVAEGRARWPENWSLVWAEGQADLAAGRCDEAIACFGALLEVDPASLPAHGVAYDERLFGSFAHAAIGLAHFRAGRYAEAARAYAAAERSEPDAVEHRVKRQLAESRSAGEQATAAAS